MKKTTSLLLTTMVVLVSSNPLDAQCVLDEIRSPGLNGPSNAVQTLLADDPDGPGPLGNVLYAGGGFDYAGKYRVNRISMHDGTQWLPMGNGISFLNLQIAMRSIVRFNGDVYAGGDASNGDCVFRWNGTSWIPLSTGGASDSVRALIVYNGELIAAGDINGAPKNIARWTGSGWSALGGGVSPGSAYVAAMIIYQGDLIAAGTFLTAGPGVPVNYIARWNGTNWSAMSTGITDGPVNCLAIHNGDLIVGGGFDVINGIAANGIARFDGTTWHPMGAGASPAGNPVKSLCVYNNDLFVGGLFDFMDNVPARNLTRWDGNAWHSVGPGHGIEGSVNALAVYNDQLAVGGTYYEINNRFIMHLAFWNGKEFTQTQSGGFDNSVLGFVESGDDLFAVGGFENFGSKPVNQVARWQNDSWEPVGSGVSGPTLCGTNYDGKLIVAGQFNTPKGNIAQWDGISWSSLDTGVSGNSNVVSAVVNYEGSLICGGTFNLAGSTGASNVARWDGQWSPLGAGLNNWVRALTVYQNQLIAGGSFTNWVARWDGQNWVPFGSGFNGTVQAFGYHNGQLYAGGVFTQGGVGGGPYVVRWNGTNWGPVGNSASLTPVNALTSLGGRLIAGCSSSLTVARGQIAVWDATNWEPLAYTSDAHGVYAALAWRDQLFAGGYFFSLGNTVSPMYIVYEAGCPQGDLNCDNSVAGDDIRLFTRRLIQPSSTLCEYLIGDFDGDGIITTADVPGFVNCLISAGCD